MAVPAKSKPKPGRVPLMMSRTLGDFAARDSDSRSEGTCPQALREFSKEHWVRFLHGDVIDHRQRLSTDTQDIVDVHGNAVDANGVVLADHLRHEELRADTIGRDCDADVANLDHVGEETEGELDMAEAHRPGRESVVQESDQGLETRFPLEVSTPTVA